MTRHVAALIRQAIDQLPESLSDRGSLTTAAKDSTSERTFRDMFSLPKDASGRHTGLVIMSKELAVPRYSGLAASDCHTDLEALSHRLGGLLVECLEHLSDVLDFREPYTLGHSLRVRNLAAAMAWERWGASPDLASISLAGQLHDIGKTAVSPEILTKPGKLTDEEWAIMKTHPVIGESIVQPVAFLGGIAEAIRHHHERFDGSGYPDSLVGNDIPVFARILAIADSYDSMTSVRPYRDAISPSEAIKEIQANAGILYDPYWVQVFLKLMESKRG